MDDPVKTAAIDDSLDFRAVQFAHVIPGGAGDLADWSHFGNVLLGLAFKTAEGLVLEGSAVMIGPGIALAAKHVIEPRLERIMASDETPLLVAVTEHGLQLWKLHQIVKDDTDVVILRIDLASQLPPDNAFHTAALTARIPAIGERVQIAGFRSGKTVGTRIAGQVRVGVGEVTAVYASGRDRVMLPHPCIEVKCLTIGGMSGGPAFDESGHLVGVLASSIEHDEGPSYVSLASPVYGHNIESMWVPGVVDLPTSIFKLADTGLVGLQRA